MSKRDDAFRKFVDKLDSKGIKMSAKEALVVFDELLETIIPPITRSPDEVLVAALDKIKEAVTELDPNATFGRSFIREQMKDVGLDPDNRSDSIRIGNALKESGLVTYEPPRRAQYVKRLTNGNGTA